MYILGIESTCDETAASVVKDGKTILSNVIASQADLHEKYGGVYPEVASRRHIETIFPVIESALLESGISAKEIGGVAVARGPGLMGPLIVGLSAAKGLSMGWGVPLIGVNHVEAHLYAAMMDIQEPQFPALGVVLSGGHTFLLKISSLGSYEMIGTTVDDALGETFDKVARILGLGYPGGPLVELLAKKGDPKKFPLKPGVVRASPWNFSFSGLKTAVLLASKSLNTEEKADLAASFQETALSHVCKKACEAATHFGCKEMYLGGGVTMNKRLSALFHEKAPVPVHFAGKALCLDNAAMIAALGFHKLKETPKGHTMDLEPLPRIPLG